MWRSLVHHKTAREIMNDTGLAQIGDTLVNLCYSVAKSLTIGKMVGEKVRDSVLAKAIRSNPIYGQIGRRTDAGAAGDAYEAIMAYLWLTGQTTIEEIITILRGSLVIDDRMSRKREAEAAALAFQKLLETMASRLPRE